MSNKIRNLTVYALLTAIMAVMAFTHLGYIKIGLAAEITLMSIPVIVGISFSGFKGGMYLGAVFGLTSFIQCFGMSPLGEVLLSVNPILMTVTCFVPRILMGLFAGLIFDLLKKKKVKSTINYIVVSVLTPLFNTILFLTCLILSFGKTDVISDMAQKVGAENMFTFAVLAFGLNAALEIAVCIIVGPAICKAVEKVRATH